MEGASGYTYVDSDAKQVMIVEGNCLPDTVDPRGPKGK
jgi:hypothetical protein